MPNTLAQSWLALQCQMIPSVRRALVSLNPAAEGPLTPSASWPEGTEAPRDLAEVSRLALRNGAPVIEPGSSGTSGDGAGPALLAYPLLNQGQVFGVVALELEGLRDQQEKTVIQLLHWGGAWLNFLLSQETAVGVAGRLATVVETTATILERRRLREAATAAVSQLAKSLGCERVSLGLVERRQLRLRALSDTAELEHRTQLIRDIEAAMEEAIDEAAPVVYPPLAAGSSQATNAHERLARRHADKGVCTVPLSNDGSIVGALTFERSSSDAFDTSTVDLCDAISSLLGPVLELKREQDRWIGAKVGHSIHGLITRLVGPRHPWTKLAAASLLALVAFLGLATGQHRVAGDAVLEGSVQRALVAPIDGYVKTASARAGDVVEDGDLLAALDDRELSLERRKWSSERDEFVKERRRAVAKLDLPQAKIFEAQVAKAEAQLALIDGQLAHTRILAPFDGVVVNGDLSRALGAPVERGQVLFEVAPLDSYRVALQVDEADVGNVAAGQPGELALAALPGETFPLVVEQIIALAEAVDGRNVFRVEARLEGSYPFLRPGMKGVGKVDVEPRKLLWIWTHRLAERVRLWLWARLP